MSDPRGIYFTKKNGVICILEAKDPFIPAVRAKTFDIVRDTSSVQRLEQIG